MGYSPPNHPHPVEIFLPEEMKETVLKRNVPVSITEISLHYLFQLVSSLAL